MVWGVFFLVRKSFLLIDIPSVESEIMSGSSTPMSGADRMRKHRAENQPRTGLSHLKQQLKRSQLLASGSPEADRMKKQAAERKRLQRMRAKEKAESSVVERASEGEMEMPGDSSSSSSPSPSPSLTPSPTPSPSPSPSPSPLSLSS